MIKLPPGVSINYEVTVVVHDMSEDFLSWWEEIGGLVSYGEYYDAKGRVVQTPYLRYGHGRLSHRSAGNPEFLIRFRAEDANVALMMLMKWDNLIISHNMREVEKMKELHNA
jgi:hypothetical protein